MRVRRFDQEKLARDRDQLWAEAAAREATGASIRLDPKLWPAAAEAQARRMVEDPYIEALRDALGDKEGKISSTAIWTILDMKPGHCAQDHNRRVGAAMRKLGWDRPNKGGVVRIEGKVVSGYIRGPQPWKCIKVFREKDRGLMVCYDKDGPDGAGDMGNAEPNYDPSPRDLPF